MKRFFMMGTAITLTALSALTSACGGSKDGGIVEPPDTNDTTPPPPPPPPGAAPVTVVMAGNIANCNGNDAATASAIDTMGATAVVLALGDNDMRSGCYAGSWGRFLSRTYATTGNHDWDTVSGTATAHFNYFGAAAGAPGQGWQAFDVGDWRVIMLTVHDYSTKIPAISYGPGSEQMAWLQAELTANASRKCTMVVMHNGYYLSSNSAGFITRNNLQPVFNRLYGAGVDVVVSANEHRYERFAPMDANGTANPTHGIRSFNVGTGGESVLAGSVVHPGSEKQISAFGVLRMKLSSTGYEWAFVNTQNPADTDTGTGACH